jgi:hypothetical protein
VSEKKDFFCSFIKLILDSTSDATNVGNDTTLGWSITAIQGHFVKGYLEGIVFCELQDGRTLVATVEKGVFHGPLILQAINQILPVN